MPVPETIGKIIPAYGGILSQDFCWNQDRLDIIAKRADLRTTITIKEGNAREERAYENLGDALAWKKIANPLDLLKTGADKKGHAETSPIFASGSAEVYLNHQQIMQEVMERNSGQFSEQIFTGTIDNLTRQGIGNIIAREKLIMAAGSGLILGINLAFLGAGGELANLFLQGTFTGLAFIRRQNH